MRWVSWDQKPAWFNSIALDASSSVSGYEPRVQEIEPHYNQRFTVCTCVDSAAMRHTAEPPPVGILFKGEPGGKVRRDLDADPDIPQWMHATTQCKGSYRAEDMVELLDKTLPVAEADSESIVVVLDWIAAHREPSVVELIESKGHVLLLHGGGTTGYEQVNDTHLHAAFQKL